MISTTDVQLPIFIVANSKGGVGKSTLSVVLVERLIELGLSLLVFDGDPQLPDVARVLTRDAFRATLANADQLVVRSLRTKEPASWLQAISAMEAHPDHIVLVALPSHSATEVLAHGHILQAAAPELRRRLVNFWVIEQQRSSLELLLAHLEVFPASTTHVVRNACFGEESEFELYNQSKVRARIESTGGSSLTFPALHHSLALHLQSKHLSFAEGVQKLDKGQAYLLRRWRESCHLVFDPVLASPRPN